MAPSQLKALKLSLRESGINGPQHSKKKRKNISKPSPADRHAALQSIRDTFNPFELRAPSARPAKHQHTTSHTNGAGSKYKDVLYRPGVSKSAGEAMRREKLLPELQRRNKVGGLVDRRIGEGDRGMNAEERAVKRFAAAKGSRSLFDLEGSEDEDATGFGLTHGGRRIDELVADDFGESEGGSEGEGEVVRRKRRRSSVDEDGDEDGSLDGAEQQGETEQPDRKRSKKEVMQEVMAKSKMHKYERQKAKEDDDDLREELDKGVDDMLAVLRGYKRHQPAPAPPTTNGANGPVMNPDRQKLLDGMDRAQADKEYDTRLKQLAQDAKAQPSERTKTDDERAREEAERLKDLEERRVRRMKGEDLSEDGDDVEENPGDGGDDDIPDEAAEFGFQGADIQKRGKNDQLVLDDEDDFALDEDLIASDSEIDVSAASESDQDSATGPTEDEEDEFVKDILGDTALPSTNTFSDEPAAPAGLAYTYPCPRTHAQLLSLTSSTPFEQLPTIIQRIRALHHPSLSAENKEAMADFSAALVQHLAYMGNEKQPLAITEQVIRHLHSLSRTYPERIGEAFRGLLKSMHERQKLEAGALVVLTAIGAIYPTGDMWHQVVTPAMSVMGRWLGLNAGSVGVKEVGEKGAFLVALCLNYQRESRRVVPEALRFTLKALSLGKRMAELQREPHIRNLTTMASLWNTKSAFPELFTPFLPHLSPTTPAHRTLTILLNQSHHTRRPLTLHHHRPLPIKTSIPKFEHENFRPENHYDPDKERSDAAKLRKEYKRERKGAVRELRKDANFVAREELREKRARDEEYERKMRRVVAEAGREG